MKVEKVSERDARNLGVGSACRGNTGKLPAAEPIASSWKTRYPEDNNYIYWGHQNMMRYEKYGNRNYSYDPYRNYYSTDGPKINTTPIPPRKMDVFPPHPNQPSRKPPGFEKEKAEQKEKSYS